MPVLPLLSRLASQVLPMKEPIIEMYGVPRPEVETLLAASGASTVHAQGHDVAGPDWNSVLYIVRK